MDLVSKFLKGGVGHFAPAWTANAVDIAAMLNVHPRTVRRLARQRAIPSYRVGRALRFDPERVLNALASDALTPDSAHLHR
jgi:excisionase family DNA binding protein